MKTSNKLLIGAAGFVVIIILAFGIIVKSQMAAFATKLKHEETKETMQVSAFNKLQVAGGITVILKKGIPGSLKISTHKDILPKIFVKVEGEELIIKVGDYKYGSQPVIEVWCESIIQIKGAAAANIEMADQYSGEKLTLDFSSASHGLLNLNYKELEGDVSSAAKLDLSGSADKFDLSYSSAADIEGAHLTVKDCKISGSSAGNAKLHVSHGLEVKLSSGANLNYKGEPKIGEMNITSGGNLYKTN